MSVTVQLTIKFGVKNAKSEGFTLEDFFKFEWIDNAQAFSYSMSLLVKNLTNKTLNDYCSIFKNKL